MKIPKLLTILIVFLVMFNISSCSKDEFATPKATDDFKTDPNLPDTSVQCTGFSQIKPAVDFLFLWDNSASQLFVNADTKKALNNTINLVSNKFDYHILLAPLIVPSTGDQQYLVTTSTDGLSSSARSKIIPSSSATSVINFASAGSTRESGLQRALNVVNENASNGIFRQNAHTIIVIMSNEDDSDHNYYNRIGWDTYIGEKYPHYIHLRDNVLHSLQMRFISLVAFSACNTGYTANYIYREMSKRIYTAPPTLAGSPTDQAGKASPDSYDICSTSFNSLFDGLNNSITDIILKHKYNYWPIGKNSEADFDPGKIEVTKKVNNQTVATLYENDPNGFTYVGYRENQNTRYEPTSGEPYTGYMIKLNGTGVAVYPECVVIKTQRPAAYFGYVKMDQQPIVNSIQLFINGQPIPQNTTNGWDYIGYKEQQNIRVISPSNLDPGSPAENYTGYFLKLYGSAVYTNGAEIQVIYDPAPTL